MRLFGIPILAAIALASGACSSFHSEWRRGSSQSIGRKSPFDGSWKGQWTSAKHRTKTGYSGGELRCVLTQIDEHHYRAHFNAHWKIFSNSFLTVLDGERHGSILHLSGYHDLPKMFGGRYHYSGRIEVRASGDRFVMSYNSSYDHGSFEMQPFRDPR